MPRAGRSFEEGRIYHVYNRVGGGWMAFSDEKIRERFIGIFRDVVIRDEVTCLAYCLLGNHTHLVVKFEGLRPVSRETLRAKTRLMYPSKTAQFQIDGWSEEKWEHYRRRLFDVSEYMRNIQSAFARWYNQNYQRRGRFWADRFKSVVLGDMAAVLDCMLYVELNPVRAGLVQRPEEWQGSSVYLRELGKDGWLSPLGSFLLDQPSPKKALREFRERLYYRGNVPTKEGQAAISQAVLDEEIARGFTSRGVYRKRMGYFVDGLAIGTEQFIRDQLTQMRESGQYLRRKHPIPQLGGVHLSLREQRTTAVIF